MAHGPLQHPGRAAASATAAGETRRGERRYQRAVSRVNQRF